MKFSGSSAHVCNVQASAIRDYPDMSGQLSEQRFQREGSIPLTFDHVYRTYFHDVCRWARALGGRSEDVEDIAQEVFIVVRRKLGGFDGPQPKPWLYRITQRTVSDYRRRAWFRRTVRPAADFFLQLIDPSDSPHELVQQQRAEERVGRILEKMSLVRRAAFVLHEVEGLSPAVIAELEAVPLATVYTRLHHARKDFLRALAKEDLRGIGK